MPFCIFISPLRLAISICPNFTILISESIVKPILPGITNTSACLAFALSLRYQFLQFVVEVVVLVPTELGNQLFKSSVSQFIVRSPFMGASFLSM